MIKAIQKGESILIYCPGCEEPHGVTKSWKFNGDFENPTLSPSLRVSIRPRRGAAITVCHSFITAGKIKFLNDCKHGLVGQTIDLPEYPEEFK